MNSLVKAASILCAMTLSVSSTVAQETDTVTRYPTEGISLLDCDPSSPAPQDSCTLRVPPGYKIGRLQSDGVGDNDAEFQFIRQDSARFPDGLILSATLLLIDLSPGANGGRRATFETERSLIAELVDGMPDGQPVAIYGFNETLQMLQDFTSNKESLQTVVGNLSLGGTNTLISTYVNDAVKILAERDDFLFRNIILVTDGDDESGVAAAEVAAFAASNETMISSLGTYWRPIGARLSGEGIAYLLTLADGTRGQAATVSLRNPNEAGSVTGAFIAEYGSSAQASGLILPRNDAKAATISVTVEEPVRGQPELASREVSVGFTPAVQTDAEGVDEEGADDELLFGYEPTFVYAAAGALGLLLIGLLFFALRRQRDDPEDDDDLADVMPPDHTAIEPMEPETPTVIQAPVTPQPSAYLMFEDGRDRRPVFGTRISVGRSASNDVVVDADGISRLHAQIYRNKEGKFSIADMDSLNGTFVNDKKIEGTEPVGLGDVITFGKVRAKLTPA